MCQKPFSKCELSILSTIVVLYHDEQKFIMNFQLYDEFHTDVQLMRFSYTELAMVSLNNH